jgi:hypothetical protein
LKKFLWWEKDSVNLASYVDLNSVIQTAELSLIISKPMPRAKAQSRQVVFVMNENMVAKAIVDAASEAWTSDL